MKEHVLKPSELKFLLKKGINNYRWKSFLNGGSFPKILLENTINNQEFIGKIVSLPSDGELKIWPKLQHQNLNPLLDILCIDNDRVRILISPAGGKCIAHIIEDNNFMEHPLCFERKRSYVKDILLGINYMHQNSAYHLNINDVNVEITHADKAIMCDFSHAVARKKISKSSLPPNVCYKPPEIENVGNNELLSSISIDMWYCGLLFLQIFSQHLLPWCGIVDNTLDYLDIDLLRNANKGAHLQERAAADLKRFLKKFISRHPNLRTTANEAIKLSFLLSAHNRLDMEARRFWKADENLVQDASKENNFTNAGTCSCSSCSEIDVSAASENKDFLGSSRHSDVCHPTTKAQLARTKSEPVHEEHQNRDLQVRASFPTLNKNKYDIPSLNSHEGSNVSDEYDSESEQPAMQQNSSATDSTCQSDEEEIDAIQNECGNSNVCDKCRYDVFLTEWEPDFYSTDNANCSVRSKHRDEDAMLEADKTLSNCFSFCDINSALSSNPLSVGNASQNENDLWTENYKNSYIKSNDYNCDSELNVQNSDEREMHRRKSACQFQCSNVNCQAYLPTKPVKVSKKYVLDNYNHRESKTEMHPSYTNMHSIFRTGSAEENTSKSMKKFTENGRNSLQSLSAENSCDQLDILQKEGREINKKSLCAVSKSAKHAMSRREFSSEKKSIDSERVEFNIEENHRKKWYHKFCSGCKNKRK